MAPTDTSNDLLVKINTQLNDIGFKELFANIDLASKKVNNIAKGIKLGDVFNVGTPNTKIFSDVGSTFADNIIKSQKELEIFSNEFGKKAAAINKKEYTFNRMMFDLELSQQETLFKRAKKRQAELMKPPEQPPFAGYAMSIMFAGMAIQRTMSQITKFGTKAFNDISHSVEGTVTASDKLDGSMKYLGFTIGQAMEPVLEWLIPIVDKIGEWVDAHPGLVRVSIVIGTIAGALFTVGGMLKLAYDGFAGLGLKIMEMSTAATGASGLGKVSSALAGLKTAAGAGLLLYISYQLFGKDNETPWTTADWIKNLGLATVGGYMAGGVWGALAAFAITLAVQLNKESAKKALEDAKKTYELSQKIMSGKLTAKEYNENLSKIGMGTFTVLPQSATDALTQSAILKTTPAISSVAPIGGTGNNLTINMPIGNLYGTLPPEVTDSLVNTIQRNLTINTTTINTIRN